VLKNKAKRIAMMRINSELCSNCGLCVDSCPMEIIKLVDGKFIIPEDDCTGCKACAEECPNKAIEEID